MSSGQKEESVKEEKESTNNDEKQDFSNQEKSGEENESERPASVDFASDTNLKDSDYGDEVQPETVEDLFGIRAQRNKKQANKSIKKEKKDNPESDTSSSDSDFEDKEKSTPKTLEDLGIKLNQSNKKWRSHKELIARQLGFISPTLFTRNVAGSVNMVERLKLDRKLDGHSGCVNTLNFNSSGDLLASGSDDLDVVVWNWAKGKKVIRYESGHTGNVFQAKFMPNTADSIIVTCARDGQVRAGYLSSRGVCSHSKKLTQHKSAAHKLSIEPGSPNVFLTCGEDGNIMEIDLRENGVHRKLLCRSENRKVPLYTIFINPARPHEFAVGGRDHRCRVYDRRNLHENVQENANVLKEYCPHHLLQESKNSFASITCLAYSYDGSDLLVSYNDEDIYLFDATSSSNSEYIHKYKGHRNNATVKGVNFYGTKSEFIVSGSDCGHVFLWDKETESVLQLLEGDEAGVVNCLEQHPLYPVLATSGLDHDVKIWTPTAHEPTDSEKLKSVIIDNDNERVADRSRDPITADLFWLMVNHYARRRYHPSESDDEDDTNDEDDAGSSTGTNAERVQCISS